MKRFLVIKDYRNSFNPDIVGRFDSWEDADTFAKLCKKSDQTGLLYLPQEFFPLQFLRK